MQEAKAKYAEMKRLDTEALQITRQLGCQQCMPEPATAAELAASSAGLDQLDPTERAVFEKLHVPTPWPAQQQQQHGREVSQGQGQLRFNIVAHSLACFFVDVHELWMFSGSRGPAGWQC